MTFILTNDDGVDGPGLYALQDAIGGQGVIVAPQDALSGCSHRVTTFGASIEVERRSEKIFAVDGTPADCTRLGVTQFCPEAEVVLAGINPGGNLGADIYPSGTVAAVREAAYLGKTGIAVSHFLKRRGDLDWERATRMAARVIEDLLERGCEPGTFWNVNLPHLLPEDPEPGIAFCEPCKQPLPVDYRVEGDTYHYQGSYGGRERDPGADVDLCFSGHITVSRISV